MIGCVKHKRTKLYQDNVDPLMWHCPRCGRTYLKRQGDQSHKRRRR